MAHHVIVEFNLDKSHTYKNSPQFPRDLNRALAKRYVDNKAVLKEYGIKVLNEHHSSDCSKIKIHIKE